MEKNLNQSWTWAKKKVLYDPPPPLYTRKNTNTPQSMVYSCSFASFSSSSSSSGFDSN